MPSYRLQQFNNTELFVGRQIPLAMRTHKFQHWFFLCGLLLSFMAYISLRQQVPFEWSFFFFYNLAFVFFVFLYFLFSLYLFFGIHSVHVFEQSVTIQTRVFFVIVRNREFPRSAIEKVDVTTFGPWYNVNLVLKNQKTVTLSFDNVESVKTVTEVFSTSSPEPK